jgi:hypothetical protein
MVPSFAWVNVLDRPLTGFEVLPLTGILPWMLLLVVFIARYLSRPLVGNIAGAVLFSSVAVWVGLSSPLESSETTKVYQELTGTLLAIGADDVRATGLNFLYALALVFSACSLLIPAQSREPRGSDATEQGLDQRDIWDSQQ